MDLYSSRDALSDEDDGHIDSWETEFAASISAAENSQREVDSAMSGLGSGSRSDMRLDDMMRRIDDQLEPFLSPQRANPQSRRQQQLASGNSAGRGSPSVPTDEAARLSEITAAKKVGDARIASLEAEIERLRAQKVFDGNNDTKRPTHTMSTAVKPARPSDGPAAYGDIGAANRAVSDAELTVLQEAEQLRSMLIGGLDEFVGEGTVAALDWEVNCPLVRRHMVESLHRVRFSWNLALGPPMGMFEPLFATYDSAEFLSQKNRQHDRVRVSSLVHCP